MQAQDKGYTIKIDQFEGPFDLLLFFIERDELDIHDIPIAKITEDFLDYIRHIESLNLDLASEFILVAATLIRIKAKMLIPRKELDENNQEIDPRRELVQKLIEYKAIKDVIGQMSDMEDDQSFRLTRGNLKKEFELLSQKALVDAEWETLSLFNLLKVFQRITEKLDRPKEVVHRIFDYKYEIADQQKVILDKITGGRKVDFVTIFETCENRIHAIVTFLAMLDLINLQKIKLVQGGEINSFYLEESEESEMDPEATAVDRTEEE
ncbi:MAG: segregation/condensation protein A [Saprospiraceae bacterium]|nr:segregation/condensation protein A [Saprospiraceae bacterium]HMW38812.1 segregation/condensation protein A [Saprospiraceae bacterium]HMX88907.1 segregation/condensation protein A [Saprospiraceae bacterium]HMZ40312.1 segregation/condensation protein A [Saprospiraceae bacterium]HNA63334.1 segregation/condensation protein A [Saprospiraceae bacterium]